MKTPTDIFNYARGALRGSYGIEDFRSRVVVIIGMDEFGQALLNRVCRAGCTLYFTTDSVKEYHCAGRICGTAEPWACQPADIILDVESGHIVVGSKTIPFGEIGAEPYTQGIHDFYLQEG